MSFIRLAPGSSRPLLPIAQFFIVGFTIFVLAGGLFVLAQGGQGLLNVSRGLQWVYPGDVNKQTTLEAVLSGLVYILGFVFVYFLFMSKRFVYRPKLAFVFLAFVMMLISMFIVFMSFVISL